MRNARTADSALGQDSSRDRHEAESGARSSGGDDRISSEQFQAELDRLDLELSMMVVEEPYGLVVRCHADSRGNAVGSGRYGGGSGQGPIAFKQDRPLRRHQAAIRFHYGHARAERGVEPFSGRAATDHGKSGRHGRSGRAIRRRGTIAAGLFPESRGCRVTPWSTRPATCGITSRPRRA